MRPSETSWASQILSNMVLGIVASSAPPQAGGDHREEPGRVVAFVLEVVRQVGVEGDASPSCSSWRLPSTISARAPLRTTAVSRLPGSCIGGSSGPPVAAPASRVCSETSARWPGSGGVSSSKRCPPRLERRRPPARLIDDVLALVEAQQLRERQVEAGGDLRRDRERRARLAALDLGEHRRADPAALGQVAQREPHRVAQRVDAGGRPVADGSAAGLSRSRMLVSPRLITFVRYHVQDHIPPSLRSQPLSGGRCSLSLREGLEGRARTASGSIELAPGDAHDPPSQRPAGGDRAPGRTRKAASGPVSLAAVEFDDHPLPRPEAVGLDQLCLRCRSRR